ncbi:MAG: HAMP domain-containing histidine kinase [Gammaproteobacteria bacterium]|mgnify:CR=1 FL=1|jgi:signal transduction histidine kinase|nr:HAMP domain-containing histidine kinase [Gammaproteobacteria bacterium]MBT3725229.1 HAMP domain-containing histidine kinase [Gammaproteobacteria bacterium]MBT4195199.1 HAMP domain-containing histidine kinase [Gammaproteobacteria bacterium]MBT4449887.1 HAMP domain-containing histidine kinase [Gammaproteobacteria bacterium]MBT4863428.1 HAMP domain-containing histidine kinase [Gammaproteobacteria bacterium]
MFIIIAAISSLSYSLFIWVMIDKLEYAMLNTLVGHEVDELVSELAADPEGTAMPKTASVHGYLLSRDSEAPVPEYLKVLDPNIHSGLTVGDITYHVAILDLNDDRLYLAFDVTHLSRYGDVLLVILIGGGFVAAFFLLGIGLWLTRKFLLPVSNLAEEVANIDPTIRNVRIEEKYRDYEVGLIAKSIDQFMDRMDAFVEREQSFTAAVSHELRTPVSVISTSIELLELNSDISKNQQRTIDRINSSTKYMRGVIESLLYFARSTVITSDKTIPRIQVSAVFQDILQEYKTRAAEKHLSLKLKSNSHVMVRMPEGHLTIILGNLVQNAINNTDNGEICVTVSDDWFSVEDTGRGIDEGDIDHIIERCYHSPDSPGCGLGLHLVMNICNNYGLKLEIESSVGSGSKFVVKLPESIIH